MQYQTLLWRIKKGRKKIFSISHTVVGHDGIGVSVKSMDNYLFHWLNQSMYDEVFKDTLIVLMSDHGMHFGIPKMTDIGDLEHKLPFMIWLYPKNKLSENVNETLIHNEQSLFTLWDFRKTLLSIFNQTYSRSFRFMRSRRNLLLNKISYKRSCKRARIPQDRCPCMGDT